MRKYIFVTGGAVSDLGKTTLAASIGLLLSSRGFKVVNKKLNPCINISLGTLDPALSGEVYVNADGSEADLSLGFYERFTGEKQSRNSFATAGSLYWSVINKERMGSFLGEIVTISSHVADEIRNFVFSSDGDVVIVEVGGTVGDIESVHFLDAVGKVKEAKGAENVMYVHVENIPQMVESEDEKLVALNRSVSVLLERGIQPDMIVCRTEEHLEESLISKISIFSNLSKEEIVEWKRAGVLYETPFILEKDGLATGILKKLSIQDFKPKLDSWKELVSNFQKAENEVKIALVGKYASLRSAYQSVKEALECAAALNGVKISIGWIDSNDIDSKNVSLLFDRADGIIIPDGKGRSGSEGMMLAAAFAREKDIPLFAIGQGMHMMLTEFASSCMGLKGAGSTEISDTPYPVVIESEMQAREKRIKIIRGTKIFSAYGRELFYERCRHKYIVNSAYKEKFEEAGMYFVGTAADSKECEAVEIPDKSFYIGVQFNPEFSSSPVKVHPLFAEFIKEAKKRL